MTNKVRFLFGTQASLPQSAPSNALLFTDAGELYKGTGTGLLHFASVLSGYVDLADLQAKNPALSSKLYLTQGNKLYTYSQGTYNLVSGASEVSTFEADKVTFDNSTSTLTGENVQTAITELDGKVETNKTDITDTKGRVDVLEADNTQNKADIVELQTNEGQVKLDANDTLGFLSDKVDGVTVVVENGKLVIKGLDGLTVGSTELNQLTGINGNVQTQLTDLQNAITASASGLVFGGIVGTYADLNAITTLVNGTLYVVSVDETQENGRTLYVYSEDTTSFLYLGTFDFANEFTELLDTPNAHEANKYLMSDGSKLVFVDVDYDKLINKPSSTIVEIDSAVAKSHEHANVDTLNKFGVDTDGNPTFNGQVLSNEIVWEEFSL